MATVFEVASFDPPYANFRFPGQHQDEIIFYATRAAPVVLWWRWAATAIVFAVLALVGALVAVSAEDLLGRLGIVGLVAKLGPLLSLGWIALFLFALWWGWETNRKTVFLVTNKRLTQFVFTTPWTSYQLSLSLDKVVDTAATTHSYLQRLTGMGDLFSRSAAGAEGDFLVENILATRDLHNWLTKLLYAWEVADKKGEALTDFQPFIVRRSVR